MLRFLSRATGPLPKIRRFAHYGISEPAVRRVRALFKPGYPRDYTAYGCP